MSLTSGCNNTRYSWTALPMTKLVVDKDNDFGKEQSALLTFFDRMGRAIGDSYLITGKDGTDPNDPDMDPTPNDIGATPFIPTPEDDEVPILGIDNNEENTDFTPAPTLADSAPTYI